MRLRFTSFLTTLLVLLMALSLLAQDQGTVQGKVTESGTGNALPGANVQLEGTSLGAASDANGNYTISNVPVGTYVVRVTFVGYVTQTKTITVAAGTNEISFGLAQTVIEGEGVIVEVNRARERETPVAFSDIRSEQIDERIHGQDAPLLIKGTPGVYSYSPDGIGNGESKLYVRGFDQNYVQVLINGIPTNDPESNSVYWSNWGSVSSSAQSIQLQRGAGSSLYGAGSFGGSFNIVTAEAPAQASYGLNATFGDPTKSKYGVEYNSGLINDRFALAFTLARDIGEGNRIGARYEGVNYYTSLAYFINDKQSLKFVLHGAPQEHGYSFSGDISFFKLYGFNASPSNFLPRGVVNQLPANATSGIVNFALNDDSREVIDPKHIGLAHNFFHKPQAELHYNYDISKTSQWRATLFYSKGRGGGSSLNSNGRDQTTNLNNLNHTNGQPIRNSDGVVTNVDWARDVYLAPAFQRTSYSLHQQGGLLTSVDTQIKNMLKLTFGAEGRLWTADHPGHFTNLYGKQNVTATYARRDLVGAIGTFRRNVYQGDLEGPDSDTNIFDLFSWGLAKDDPTYRTQYRNYKGRTPQMTLFTSGNWRITEKLNALTTLQYVWYRYELEENMPSENSIGQEVTIADPNTPEGPRGNGKFLMKSNDAVPKFYEFTLVSENRSRGFLQPKGGLNYNVNDNLNVFGSFAHAERFVNLDIYYASGRVFPDAKDEKSNQFEFGFGWRSSALTTKVNAYHMTWENKSTRIQDITKAGEPGYDRNGFRSELVGTSKHKGVEVEVVANLNSILPVKGLALRGSVTYMDNKWTDILDEVAVDASRPNLQEDTNLNGKLDAGEDTNGNTTLQDNRRIFNASARDANGVTDALYFIEMNDTHVASKPQAIASLGLTYTRDRFFAGLDMIYYGRDFALDGDTYLGVDGSFVNNQFVYVFDNRLPSRTVFDAQAGYRYDFAGLRGNLSVQVLNLFDKEYLADSDRFGVIPGTLRSVRFNVSTAL